MMPTNSWVREVVGRLCGILLPRFDVLSNLEIMKRLKSVEQLAMIPYVGRWLLLPCVLGALAASASALFLYLLDRATDTRIIHPWLLWLLPVAGFATGWVYLRVGKTVEGGNNLLIDEIHDPQKIVPKRMAPLVLIATVITHLFGGSAGREGTAVQMGGALADRITHVFGLDRDDRRILLMGGIAAGFSSVFGTPLAGAIFGLEVLAIGRLRYDALIPCLIAAVIGDWTCNAWSVLHTHYHVAAADIPRVDLLLCGQVLAASLAFALAAVLFAEIAH